MILPPDVGPFQRIVNVGWPSARRILALWVHGTYGVTGSGGLPSDPGLTFHAVIGSDTIDLTSAVAVARSGKRPPAPAIAQQVTSDMLSYYADWGYAPWISPGPVNESKGGGFYFIQTNFATFPDFVHSPYGSSADALSYLNAQLALHPEYNGGTGVIDFLPAFDDFSQSTDFGFLVFLNLDAYKPDGVGNYNIPFTFSIGAGGSGNVSMTAALVKGPLIVLNLAADSHNQPLFDFPLVVSFYSYSIPNGFLGETAQTGTIVVHTKDDTMTGPASPGGGGGGL